MSNRLIHETSPYLLQHAHHPVDWYPWGEDAFTAARETGKPIFLSIGYSTCHWCHVLAHESFEDEETARLLNERYISIKVDREERPDIDHLYMTAAQVMNGQGGWPLSVFMTADQQPFYIGTYFPKTPQFNRPSFRQVTLQLSEQLRRSPEKIAQVGQNMSQTLRDVLQPATSTRTWNESIIHDTFDQAMRQFDRQHGGFGEAPKFPSPALLRFLLDYYQFAEDETALHMVMQSLIAMRDGGMTDQVGYGLFRYTVDAKWEIPHFEKMLYDNAWFATVCIETYQASGQTRFRRYAEEVLTFVEKELTAPDGTFYAALDADSEGGEGHFYTFTERELTDLLGPNALFPRFYHASASGNFEGRNVFYRTGRTLEAFARSIHLSLAETASQLEHERQILLRARNERMRPFRDDKRLTSWNAMMISTFAKAGRVLGEPHYTHVATRAMTSLERFVRTEQHLAVHYRDGQATGHGFLDDYAYMIDAHLELFQSTHHALHLKEALAFADVLQDQFQTADGYFYLTSSRSDKLLVRPLDLYDGVTPAGNSIALNALFTLSRLTGRLVYQKSAERALATLIEEVEQQPTGFASLVSTFTYRQMEPKELIILLPEEVDIPLEIKQLQQLRLPEVALLIGTKRDLLPHVPLLAEYPEPDAPTAYLCHDFSCERPTTRLTEILARLNI
ncbi:thioredoxin domain-containing protein [Exiguobacterium acetylicum]|uniref:thioredoxin domain-containing protein n=1 Tax=Exiguobacterium acetylicum TaxID=41170 RepID=UPI0027E0E6BB|nr:thioredoxin domain-containing protein [Exiguobacterium acetylicum]MDQ6467794.1 thioredoxin domain-containing protein [Exiguobacterium acetylicum]